LAERGLVAADVLREAGRRGITYVDTAPSYGLGAAEEIVRDAQREESFGLVSTKVGRILDGSRVGWHFDFTAPGIRTAIEASLRRLDMSRIDIAYLHDPEEQLAPAMRQAVPELRRLRDEGLVGAIGVGTTDAAAAHELVINDCVEIVLIANRFTLLDQSAGKVLGAARARGIPVVVAGVFNSGILAAPEGSGLFDYRPPAADVLARVALLRDVTKRFETSLATVALQFPRRYAGVSCTLLGCATPAELAQCLDALDKPLPVELWHELENARLIPNTALTRDT
jgi:Predicted oxidoreductases (related to aryl-alcohol dehydrogenases)